MIAIVDYGVGNLFSLKSSCAYIGAEAEITGDAADLRRAEKILLPGVGAFRDAARKLKDSGLWEPVISEAKNGKPLMGICLGMQLLFDRSFEYGDYGGLGLIPGEVVSMRPLIPPALKIPQIGWNALRFPKTGPKNELFKYVEEGEHVYFVHSYCATGCGDAVIATTEYGIPITAAVCAGTVWGCQFHPEKSGNTGLNILRAFCGM